MKNIYIALIFVLAIANSIAQNKETKIADKLYESYQYVDATKEYLKLANTDKTNTYVFKQLGDCYYNYFNSVEAEKWYSKAIATEQNPETYFRYAQMLKTNKKYDEASVQMQKFAALAPNDMRGKNANSGSEYLNNLLGQTKLFDVYSVGLNSKYSDFGAYLKDNTIYFTSARNTARKSYDWNDQPFLDIYQSDFTDGKVGTTSIAVADLNTKFHEGPVTISADGNTMYFSRESFFENKFTKSQDRKLKNGKMYIYKATKTDGKWGNIATVSFNEKESNTTSPSLSKDGSLLYFVSDRNGSLGKTDVWKIAINTDGSFGTPENLGTSVNSEGNELTAFIADDNTLYFASNGRNGLGGLDVFACDMDKSNEAINLGKPVNSEKDDFGFTFNQEKNVAFLSSNRAGGAGDDDIYSAIPYCTVDLRLMVRNAKSSDPLSNASVIIVDEMKNVVTKLSSDDMGKTNFKLECDKAYFANVDKDGYISNVFPIDKSKGIIALNADLNPVEAIITETEVILNEIKFEYNKSNITADGAFELDKLVVVMEKYPNMVIFAKSHTDSRGKDSYNLGLSDRRAKSTVEYLLSKGVSLDRITGQGFGETEPKIICGNDCTEEQHAENRRSEFLIVKK